MSSKKTMLEKAQLISAILSAIAIPVVLGLIGYSVQRSIAEDGIKKDYLTMAVAMLRDGDNRLDPELKAWATAVVAKYSPVPFSPSAEEKLGRALYITPAIPPLHDVARQPEIGALCADGCSASLTQKMEAWRATMTDASDREAANVLGVVLDQSVQVNKELAAALDRARISGQACEQMYDSLQSDER